MRGVDSFDWSYFTLQSTKKAPTNCKGMWKNAFMRRRDKQTPVKEITFV